MIYFYIYPATIYSRVCDPMIRSPVARYLVQNFCVEKVSLHVVSIVTCVQNFTLISELLYHVFGIDAQCCSVPQQWTIPLYIIHSSCYIHHHQLNLREISLLTLVSMIVAQKCLQLIHYQLSFHIYFRVQLVGDILILKWSLPTIW